MKDPSSRPELADENADIASYGCNIFRISDLVVCCPDDH